MAYLIGSDVEIAKIDVTASMFFREYVIPDPPTDIMQDVVDWLAKNCTDNFIVTEKTTRIVAGGYDDNAKAHLRGRFNIKNRKGAHGLAPTKDYHVRLSKSDDFLFSMAWINESD
jgi:hypothetical protein